MRPRRQSSLQESTQMELHSIFSHCTTATLSSLSSPLRILVVICPSFVHCCNTAAVPIVTPPFFTTSQTTTHHDTFPTIFYNCTTATFSSSSPYSQDTILTTILTVRRRNFHYCHLHKGDKNSKMVYCNCHTDAEMNLRQMSTPLPSS